MKSRSTNVLRLPILFIFILCSVLKAKAQAVQWDSTIAYSCTGEGRILDISQDSLGNFYAVGSFTDTLILGNNTLVSAGDKDIFIVKFDNNRNVLWAKRAGTIYFDIGSSIVCDSVGNAFIAGICTGNISFGNIYLPFIGGADIFMAKLDPNGNYVWAIREGGGATDSGNELALDGLGHLYLQGCFGSTAEFGNVSVTTYGMSTAPDIFTAKYDLNGNFLWIKKFGNLNDDYGANIVADPFGNVYTTSYTKTLAYYGQLVLNPINMFDIVLTKLDSLGNVLWAKRYGSEDHDYPTGVGVDILGNPYVVGTVHDRYFIGTDTFASPTPGFYTSEDVVLTKFDTSGKLIWTKRCGGYKGQYSGGIFVEPSGYAYITGSAVDTSYFQTDTIISPTHNDNYTYVAKFSPHGDLVWLLDGGYKSSGIQVLMNQDGSLTVAGGVSNKNIIPPLTYLGNDTIHCDGIINSYLTKIVGNLASPSQIIDRKLEPEFSIYPNPVNTTIQMVCKEKGQVILYDRSGNRIKDLNIKAGQNVFDMSAFPDGFYFLKLNTATGTAVQKLLKN